MGAAEAAEAQEKQKRTKNRPAKVLSSCSSDFLWVPTEAEKQRLKPWAADRFCGMVI